MPQFLVAIHHPDNYVPSIEDEEMMEDIHALNREMIAAGVRNFAGGLSSASLAKSLRAQPDGRVLVTDGPYLETKEHIGGFWIDQPRGRVAPTSLQPEPSAFPRLGLRCPPQASGGTPPIVAR